MQTKPQNRFAVNTNADNISTVPAQYAESATKAIESLKAEKPPFQACAQLAIECGWSPIPRRDKPEAGRPPRDAKRPAIKDWQQFCDRQPSPSELADFYMRLPLSHISIACGYENVIWIDQDTDKPEIVKAYRSVIPESIVARTGSKGRADAYRVVGEMPVNRKFYSPNNQTILEILAHGSNVVIPPSMHPETGQPYRWLTDCSVYDTLPDELTTITADDLARLEEVLKPYLRQPKVKPAKQHKTVDPSGLTDQHRKRYQAMADKALEKQIAKLVTMKKGGRNDALYRGVCAVGVFMHHGFLSQQTVEDAFFAAASTNDLVKENGEKDVRATIAKALEQSSGDSLPELTERTRTQAKRSTSAGTVYSEPVQPQEDADTPPPEITDDGLALAFVDRHKANMRYVAAFNKWMFWTGAVWKEEQTLLSFDLAGKLCRELNRKVTDPKEKAKLGDAKTRSSLLTIAKADRRIAATDDQWNADDWLLNTPDGVVDLRTGDMRAHDPSDYMTKMTTVSPGGDCPKWRKFLDEVTDGKKDLQAFLQRIAGYCLTGTITEHALFFCHGKGGNGKGVFLNTVTGILDAYHTPAPVETFTESRNDRHETELAGLDGARLVTASETEEGRHWAESKIKHLTGGDPIRARYMRCDYFTFQPRFKLFIVGNHKPQIRNVDDAMRRRFHLIPFTVTIPPEKKNPHLVEELKEEWPAILQWMIDGCLEWQRVGLAPPEDVRAATDDYMQSEDSTQSWLDDMTEKGGMEYLAALFGSWKKWAEYNNLPIGSNKKLLAKLLDRGFTADKDMKGKYISGLRLKQDFIYTGRFCD